MPRLDTFEIKIRTGDSGLNAAPKYGINGFPLEFDESSGGTGAGETFVAKGEPQSFPHSLTLIGPEQGEWRIEGAEITYQCANETPYTVRLGGVTLDHRSDLNLWHPRPPQVIDV